MRGAEATARETEKLPVTSAEDSAVAEKTPETLPDPCVYCGPSVKGVARQFTVYRGGIPKALGEFLQQHPAARRLVVSEQKFAQVRAGLETPGSIESVLFRKLKEEM